MADLLYGRNAVREALRADRRTFTRLQVSSGAQEAGTLGEVVKLAEKQGVPVERVERQVLDKRLRDANHQGVTLEASDYPYVDLDIMLALAQERREPPLLLLLDHLQDPQNIGTLLRTAEVTPAVVNASSGATEHLNVSVVTNLAQTIATLQDKGVWVVGVEDDERAKEYDRADLDMPLALVVGAEGAGLARLTRERCDFLVRLPMRGQIASLNAAVAGSIVLYHAWRSRARVP